MTDKELLVHINERIRKNPYFHQIKDKNDRESIVNELFVAVWSGINEGRLKDDWKEIKGYVFISGRNNCLKYLRQRQKENKMMVDEDGISEPNDFKMYDDDTHPSYNERMSEKLDFIDETITIDIDKKIMGMRMNGYQLSDIAKELDLSLNEVDKLNRSILRYLRVRYYNPKYKKHARHWGRMKDFVYTVEDTDTGNFVEYNDKEKITKDYGINKNRINEYIDNERLLKGRYLITVLKKERRVG